LKEIKIITKTESGEKALKQHYEESLKLRTIHKIKWRAMGYKQEVTKTKPYTMTLSVTNKYFQMVLNPIDFKKQIKKALKENGATNIKDYDIKVT